MFSFKAASWREVNWCTTIQRKVQSGNYEKSTGSTSVHHLWAQRGKRPITLTVLIKILASPFLVRGQESKYMFYPFVKPFSCLSAIFLLLLLPLLSWEMANQDQAQKWGAASTVAGEMVCRSLSLCHAAWSIGVCLMQQPTSPCLIRPMQEPGVHNKIIWSKPEDQEKFVFRIIIHVPKAQESNKKKEWSWYNSYTFFWMVRYMCIYQACLLAEDFCSPVTALKF